MNLTDAPIAILGSEVQRDVVYGRAGDRELRLHLVRPRGRRRELLPGLVLIHGGGWHEGSRDHLLLPAAMLAREGYIAASIEYRLSDEATFPGQIEDCKCAVRYLRAHSQQLGLDPMNIGAFGVSAGGHLAALLGTTAGEPALEGDGGWAEQSSSVQAVVDWFGPSDLTVIAGESPTSSVARLLGGVPGQVPELALLANPVAHASERSAPFLIMHGDIDALVPLSQSELLHAALLAAGAESELIVVEGRAHGFLGVKAALRTAAFLRHHLKGSRANRAA